MAKLFRRNKTVFVYNRGVRYEIASRCSHKEEEQINEKRSKTMILRSIIFALFSVLCLSNLSSAVEPMTKEKYFELFLKNDDFPDPMRMVQDSRLDGLDPNDKSFGKNSGMFNGFAVWMGRSDSKLWRIVDIRWVFPDEPKAKAYYLERLQYNCENWPFIPKAAPIAIDAAVCGGEKTFGFGKTTNPMILVNYFYVFRIKNVVVKLYAAQGSDVPKNAVRLSHLHLLPIAQKIKSKISNVIGGNIEQQGSQNQPARIRRAN